MQQAIKDLVNNRLDALAVSRGQQTWYH